MQRAELFNAHPKSLFFHRDTDEPRPEVATSRFRQALLTISGFYSKESQLLRGNANTVLIGAAYRSYKCNELSAGSKNLYQATVQQAADPRLYEGDLFPNNERDQRSLVLLFCLEAEMIAYKRQCANTYLMLLSSVSIRAEVCKRVQHAVPAYMDAAGTITIRRQRWKSTCPDGL